MLGISVSKVLVFLFTSFLARFLIKAFAVDPWMYYLGGLVDIISTYSFSILKAMTVLCVSPNELGKINAVLAALEGLFPALLWGWDPRGVDVRGVPPNVVCLTSLIVVDQART